MRENSLWVVALAAAMLGGCDKQPGEQTGQAVSQQAQVIAIDGSSTVYPITEAVAEEFKKKHPARVTIGVSGTGGGFKKFCRGETAITNASRPIKAVEHEECAKNKVEYIELPIAYDGIAIVVNPRNDWVDHLTTEELKRIWQPEAQEKVKSWDQIRPGWPKKELRLFGPGIDSGTYDYFTEAVMGKERSSRGDFTSSEDDNVLVHGVSSDLGALGFFGLAYYEENRDKLKIVPLDDGKKENGDGPVTPTFDTVANGTYQPLSRPLFIYLSRQAVERKEVQEFVKFYLNSGRSLTKEVGYIPLPEKAYQLVNARFEKRTTGSVFGAHGSQVGVTIEQLLAKE